MIKALLKDSKKKVSILDIDTARNIATVFNGKKAFKIRLTDLIFKNEKTTKI